MFEIEDYFSALNFNEISLGKKYEENQLGSKLIFEATSLENIDIAIFDVQEDRRSDNIGCAKAGMEVRKHLFELYQGDYDLRVIDLGSIKAGNTLEDTHFAVEKVVESLIKKEVVPLIIGGSQDLTLACYKAYEALESYVNLVSIDARFPIEKEEEELNASNYFSKILFHDSNTLFNFSNLGYQSFYVDNRELEVINGLFFDIHRLGALKSDIRRAEPIIRNADFISFNMSAIAYSFMPANINAGPNGFTGEEACQIARYAGMSDKLTSIGFYELNPTLDDRGMSAHLLAQMIWYFIDGFYNRKKDYPVGSKKRYIKYMVPNSHSGRDIVFYKSPKSDRWWMEVPYPEGLSNKYKRHLMLPCTYEEYLVATADEIPERWFKTLQKLK